MAFHETLPDLTHLSKSISLAIGNFDGVHAGHSYLIDTMRSLSSEKGSVIILSFTNNPKEILEMKHVPRLSSDLHDKESVLHNQSVDEIIFLPFTIEISNTTYVDFITHLRAKIPFEHLVFGEGEAIGKNLEGTPENITLLSKNLGFNVHYIPKLRKEKLTISSTAIRTLLFQGKFKEANTLLGYNYTITLSSDNYSVDTDLIKPGTYLVTSNDLGRTTIKISSKGIVINPKIRKNITLEFIEKIT